MHTFIITPHPQYIHSQLTPPRSPNAYIHNYPPPNTYIHNSPPCTPGFCLRFADDFEVSWDDWKPQTKKLAEQGAESDVVMNAMVVPNGTYEICTDTRRCRRDDNSLNIKWILNINWVMKGLGGNSLLDP